MALTFPKGTCDVCRENIGHCYPSHFSPLSYWICKECVGHKRIAYWELLLKLASSNEKNYNDCLNCLNDCMASPYLPFYADAYFGPTLEFYNKSETEAWNERDKWAIYREESKYRKSKYRQITDDWSQSILELV